MSEFRDHDPRFVDYYAEESLSPRARERFTAIMELLLAARAAAGLGTEALDVGDVGCNAGTQSIMWARAGHRVRGIDISTQLVEIAQRRATEAGLAIDFGVASATSLPWPDASLDVCIAPELLEHVEDWEAVVDECARVTRPGGVVYFSTTNSLCPKQYEFSLPMYSWYPAFLKRHYERLSVTTRPELVNHARYPAVHWFTYYGLRKHMAERGFVSMDRFDLFALKPERGLKRFLIQTLRALPPLRWLGHVATPYTVILSRRAN
ncbi:MAG TPA: class I SAM-dependent methyltransferase [Steroidobacteraceae bacterium]|nr:class I SAM-dependent methyltransferase [Steroidobacteraceae bacterium]HRX88943.1 class I SAM-dependent methyltransferase [Steroidobacteraceae bacterium]